MTRLTLILLAFLICAPLTGQTRPELKKQLKAMQAQAKSDTNKLYEAAAFAKEHDFSQDYKKLIKQILKLDPDHKGANESMGRVKYKGKWLAKAEYEKQLAAALEAKFKAQGKVKTNGIWVDKSEVADAKRGLFHHDGELVNKFEKRQFQAGKIRHPRTGEFIDPADKEKADQGLFPLPDGRWVKIDEANKFHEDRERPWVIRTKHAYLISTIPLKDIEKMGNVTDVSVDCVIKIFGAGSPMPQRRPVIRLVNSTERYRALGEDFGTGDDSYGVFLASGDDAAPEINGSRARMVIMNYGEAGWRETWVRHASGLATSHSFCGDQTDDVPAWFHRGVASLAARHMTPDLTKAYGEQVKADMGNLADWFDDFKINMDVSTTTVHDNIYKAGLVLVFCIKGGNKKCTDALLKVTAEFQKGDKAKLEKTILKFQKTVAKQQDAVVAYHKKTTGT